MPHQLLILLHAVVLTVFALFPILIPPLTKMGIYRFLGCLVDTRVMLPGEDTHLVETFHGHEGDVNVVKFFPDGNRFGTGSDDGTCRLFNIRTGHQLQVYYQQQQHIDIPRVTSISFSVSGRLLFAGYTNGDLEFWISPRLP